MEVCVPCNNPTGQNLSRNSGFSLDSRNLTRCNARDVSVTELKTCLTELLHIQDNRKSSSDFCLSSDRNDVSSVAKKDGCKDFNESTSSSSASENLFKEYETIPSSGEFEASLEVFVEKEMQEADGTSELPDVNTSVEQSLPAPLKLVSAMKGSRAKQGVPTKKLSVTWAPDVYDPVPSSVSHFLPHNNQHYRSNGKRSGKNKQKGGSKSLRGSKSKDKKQARKSSGNANKFKSL